MEQTGGNVQIPYRTVTDESCLSPLVSHCPQCHGHRRACLTIPVDDPGGIYRDKARVSLAARRAIDKDVAPERRGRSKVWGL